MIPPYGSITKLRSIRSRKIASARRYSVLALIGQQRIEVTTFPALGLIVVLEHRLVGEEFLGVELPASVLHTNVMNLMKHLVEHDPRHEEPRHERAIERAMDAD